MTWALLYTDAYDGRILDLTDAETVDVLAMVEVLEMTEPNHGRPYADTLHDTSKVKNLKELRIQHDGKPYRVFYAFDPVRRAVLLCGGRKDGKIINISQQQLFLVPGLNDLRMPCTRDFQYFRTGFIDNPGLVKLFESIVSSNSIFSSIAGICEIIMAAGFIIIGRKLQR